MNKILLAITIFSLGYVANDILREMNVSPISDAYAGQYPTITGKILGVDVVMDSGMLKEDGYFAKAVRELVSEHCVSRGFDLKVFCGYPD